MSDQKWSGSPSGFIQGYNTINSLQDETYDGCDLEDAITCLGFKGITDDADATTKSRLAILRTLVSYNPPPHSNLLCELCSQDESLPSALREKRYRCVAKYKRHQDSHARKLLKAQKQTEKNVKEKLGAMNASNPTGSLDPVVSEVKGEAFQEIL
ncbi:hypothetical protein C8Q75DRAFT_807390 [Abortiporus biennis]|nr:hypothetical protein C8Q75DRAFT_807390 [Abortiporus biennis]